MDKTTVRAGTGAHCCQMLFFGLLISFSHLFSDGRQDKQHEY